MSQASSEQFPSTHWTVLMQLRAGGEEGESSAAWERLCAGYWYPLYAFLRRAGHTPEAAEDRVQSFFVELLKGTGLRQVDPARGRFRSYLLGALKRHVAEEMRREHRLKRRPAAGWLALDGLAAEERYGLEPRTGETPEMLYERAWAWALLDATLARLRDEFRDAGKSVLFDGLVLHLTDDAAAPSHAEIAAQTGMSEGAVRVAAMRLRARFGRLLREELNRVAGDEQEADAELRHLAGLWSR